MGLPAYNAAELLAPVSTLRATVALGKSRMFRDKAAKFLNYTTMEGCVVIAVDRHDLGVEQLGSFYEEHPNTALVARIWRGRGAVDPEQRQPEDPSKPRLLMCLRNKDAEEVGKHGLSVEKCLCRHVDRETKEETSARTTARTPRCRADISASSVCTPVSGSARTKRCYTRYRQYLARC